MKNPTKDQVQVVINKLKLAKDMTTKAGFIEAPVDMIETEIHRCGTPMCHAGYYALASGIDDSGVNDFEEGAVEMAKDLGFSQWEDTMEWADKNPDLWGNNYGRLLFSASRAFSTSKVKDLQQIIDHWKGVQERLPV